MGDIPEQPKREWYDGRERICDGSVIVYGEIELTRLHVNELPKEVYAIMATSQARMIELHHYADPAIEVYVNQYKIIVIDARWSFVEDH